MVLQNELFATEEGFWLEGEEHFRRHVDERCLLAFPQAGEMHGIHSAEQVAATATPVNRWRDLAMSDRFVLDPVDEAVIISYRADVTLADGEPYSALVSSAYARRPEGWKLAFHQHSPI